MRGLIVETGSPDALCPDLAGAEQAISSRLGGLEVSGSWRVRYTIVHAPDGSREDFVQLELFDEEARLRLERELPLGRDGCAAMAQVIALVVDRFFRSLGEDDALSAAAPPQQEASPKEEAPPPRRDVAPVPPWQKRDVKGRPYLFSVEGGVLSAPLRPTLGLELSAPFAGPFSLATGLSWTILPAQAKLPRGGEAELHALVVRIDPSWDIPVGPTIWGVGPTLSLSMERGTASPPAEGQARIRAVMGAGASFSLKIPLISGLFIGLGGGWELPFRPFSGRFLIENDEVLAPPSHRAFLEAGVGTALFR